MPRRRVLSLWQPWASFTMAKWPGSAIGVKAFETRHWRAEVPTPFDVVMHATKTWNRDVREMLAHPTTQRLAADLFGGSSLQASRQAAERLFPFGKLIGVARVTAMYRTIDEAGPGDEVEEHLGNWERGRWAWKLEDAIALPEPIPFTGRQEPLYFLADEVNAQVEAQLAAMPRG